MPTYVSVGLYVRIFARDLLLGQSVCVFDKEPVLDWGAVSSSRACQGPSLPGRAAEGHMAA